MNRLDAVTIRIGLPDTQTDRAAQTFGLPWITPSRSTLHLIDYRSRSAPSSLASAGVTISVHDSGDLSLLTVQVRYVRSARLPARWAAFYGCGGETLRIEEERDSTRRVLAASYSAPSRHAAPALA